MYADINDLGGQKIRKIYEDLTTRDILERCTRGLSQNANESFHAKLWAKAKKTKFLGKKRLDFVARMAVLDHNFRYKEANLIASILGRSSNLDSSLQMLDADHLRHVLEVKKKRPVRVKKDENEKDYLAGAF